jgi:hypothetical protein
MTLKYIDIANYKTLLYEPSIVYVNKQIDNNQLIEFLRTNNEYIVELDISGSYLYPKKIVNLPVLPNLTKLTADYLVNLVNLPSFPKLEYLSINECNSLKTLSSLPNLTELWCCMCYNLTNMPTFPNLKRLVMNKSVNIENIDSQPELEELGCNSCYKLQSLPTFPKLKTLEYINTPLEKHCIPINLLTNPSYKELDKAIKHNPYNINLIKDLDICLIDKEDLINTNIECLVYANTETLAWCLEFVRCPLPLISNSYIVT